MSLVIYFVKNKKPSSRARRNFQKQSLSKMGLVLRKPSKFRQVGLKINDNPNTFILLTLYYYKQLDKTKN